MVKTKSIELDVKNIDFSYLFKVTKIAVDKVTFRKYSIQRYSVAHVEGRETVELSEDIGEETHIVSAEVLLELAGKVGLLIKRFEVELIGKKKKKVVVNKIVKIGE